MRLKRRNIFSESPSLGNGLIYILGTPSITAVRAGHGGRRGMEEGEAEGPRARFRRTLPEWSIAREVRTDRAHIRRPSFPPDPPRTKGALSSQKLRSPSPPGPPNPGQATPRHPRSTPTTTAMRSSPRLTRGRWRRPAMRSSSRPTGSIDCGRRRTRLSRRRPASTPSSSRPARSGKKRWTRMTRRPPPCVTSNASWTMPRRRSGARSPGATRTPRRWKKRDLR